MAVPKVWDGTQWVIISGSGDTGVFGPAGGSTTNAVVRWTDNATPGTQIKNSTVILDDSGNFTSAGTYNGIDIDADLVKNADFDDSGSPGDDVVLVAHSNGTPSPVTMGSNTLLMRRSTLDVEGFEIPAQSVVLTGASTLGYVTMTDWSVLSKPSDVTNIQDVTIAADAFYGRPGSGALQSIPVASDRIVGHVAGGDLGELTATEVRTLINVDNGAQVCDATNVNAAGAVMESDYGLDQVLVAHSASTPSGVTMSDNSVLGKVGTADSAALVVGASKVVGRAASGDLAAIDAWSGQFDSRLWRIGAPDAADDLQVFYVPKAMQVQQCHFIRSGGAGNVSFVVEYRAQATPFSTTGTLIKSGAATTSLTSDTTLTVNVPADRWIAIEVDTTDAAATLLVAIVFRYD